MSTTLRKLLLFDPITQHYRQNIYRYFQKRLKIIGYDFKVVYDKKKNDLPGDLFLGIDYSWKNFDRVIRENKCQIIILFVWLRYKFLIPFMLFQRFKGIKMITWSHGINLQNRGNIIMNHFYYLRQKLAHGLIIFSKNEKKYIKASHKKLFVANNTLNFHDFPAIKASKEQLKEKYGMSGKRVVLCVGRMNTNNRKLDLLIKGFTINVDSGLKLVIVGPGISREQEKRMAEIENVHYLGTIFDQIKINEIYKMSDIFCMPGAIGLAINQAFFHGLPVVVEDVAHGPEGIYLKEGENGFRFKAGDCIDMMKKIQILNENNDLYERFSHNAKKMIQREATIERMFEGFQEAIQYVEGRLKN